MKLAKQVIATFDGPLDLADYKDEYREGLQRIIDAKIAGEEIVAPAVEAAPRVVNLMEALQKSLAAAKDGKRPRAAASDEARDRGEIRHRAGPEQRAAKTGRAHPPRKAAAARKRKSG